MERMSFLSSGSTVGETLKLFRPRPSSRMAYSISPAISPHMVTARPFRSAASMTFRIRRGPPLVGAVHAEGVLDQVVGPDGEEIAVVDEHFGRHGDRGHFDHDTDGD